MMVVVAILGVLAAMGFYAMEGLRRRTAPRNEAAEFSAALSQARTRAMERGSDVWVIIYPERGPTGAAGSGSYFIYEDANLDFGVAGVQSCNGSGPCNYETFLPPNLIAPLTSTGDRIHEMKYFDRTTTRNVSFGNTVNTALAYGEPFAPLNSLTKSCTFCGGAGAARRGAIVFNGDGAARFVDNTGALVFAGGAMMGGVAIEGAATRQLTLFAIAGTTGYVGLFR